MEDMLPRSLSAFTAKLGSQIAVRVRGMEDYVRVTQYQELARIEQRCNVLEIEAAQKVLAAKEEYLKALLVLDAKQNDFFRIISDAMELLDERDAVASAVNEKLRSGDFSVLSSTASTLLTSRSDEESRNPPSASDDQQAKERCLPASKRDMMTVPASFMDHTSLKRIKEKLQMASETPQRAVLKPLSSNVRTAIEDTTPVVPRIGGVIMASQGSLDGSVVPNREPPSPIRAWNVPQPNFDDTLDEECVPPRGMDSVDTPVGGLPTVASPASSIAHPRPLPSPTSLSASITAMGLTNLPRRPQLKSDYAKNLLNK